jgi:hypothetical protein
VHGLVRRLDRVLVSSPLVFSPVLARVHPALAVGATAYGMRGPTFFGFLWHHRFDLAGELDSGICIRSSGSIVDKGKRKQNKGGKEKKY